MPDVRTPQHVQPWALTSDAGFERVLRGQQAEADRIARNLVRELGDHASTVAAVRADDCRSNVDAAGVQLWLAVARHIKTILAAEAAVSPGWRLMQRIEFYRHRALEAERKAAAASTVALRQELIDIAAQWRELGLQAQLLTETPPAAEAPRRRQGSG
jgi:hypothetical protein